MAYSVYKREDRSFTGLFLAAKVSGGSEDKDAIWKQAESGWEPFLQPFERQVL